MGVVRDLTAAPPFGRLQVLYRGPNDSKNKAQWYCQCVCGTTLLVRGASLLSGNTSSCGCLRKEIRRQTLEGPALRYVPEYEVWRHMKQRCMDPKHISYPNYGGRGITICERWLESFQNFLEDMGPRPTPQHSLDRFPDKNGNYEKSNCRWATPSEQTRNMRTNRMIMLDGHTACLADWLLIKGLSKRTFHSRCQSGWTVERALMTPVMSKYITHAHLSRASIATESTTNI
jgi:hypothetical protein